MTCPFRGDSGTTSPVPGEEMRGVLGRTPVSSDSITASILGFQAANKDFITRREGTGAGDGESRGGLTQPTHYGSYLGIDTLLNLQSGPAAGKEGGSGLVHHEELTFIIVHQVFELWFKLVAADMQKARKFLMDIADGRETESSEVVNLITQCVTYLRRSEAIFHHAQGAFGIMETMHPADFLEFRDFLVPASGFQSVSFRSLEQLLGVPNATRAKVNGAAVFSYLRPEEQAQLALEARLPSVNDLVIRILCQVKVPQDFAEVYLAANRTVLEQQQYTIARADPNDPKAATLISNGMERVRSMLQDPLSWCEGVVLPDDESRDAYRKAVLAALFVTSYRFENRFSSFAALLDALIAVEEGMLLWRGRHLHMAERMIGRRSGTGGTASGVGYLDITRKYRIFHVLWLVRKMFIRASALPPFSSYGLVGDEVLVQP